MKLLPVFLFQILFLSNIYCAFKYPLELPGSQSYIYKTSKEGDLRLWAFFPDSHKPTDKRPAIVFFFGGGWKSGSPIQFAPHCRYLASRGMVAMTADYRVLSRHGTKADSCVEDGKSAIRWIRQNVCKLGVDPNKIAAGGGSAGGHVAASIGIIKGFEAEGEDHSVPSKPDALVLFNPAVTLLDIECKYDFPDEKEATMHDRAGVHPKELSPYHHIRKGLPPTIIFHGTNDSAVDHKTVVLFESRMQLFSNQCRLASYNGQPHGFFNYGRDGNTYFQKTVMEMDLFLNKLGWLNGKCTVSNFLKTNE